MDLIGLRYCSVVAVLAIASAAAGFGAEYTMVKASDVYIKGNKCVYPNSPALTLGIISAIFAIITQVYISFSSGGCRIATGGAVVMLLMIAKISNEKGGHVDSDGYFKCDVASRGFFATGAIFAVLSAIFGIAAYVNVGPPIRETTTDATVHPI
ncbi:hypothetical protein Tco_0040105 [Tanacetum coccineum]